VQETGLYVLARGGGGSHRVVVETLFPLLDFPLFSNFITMTFSATTTTGKGFIPPTATIFLLVVASIISTSKQCCRFWWP
jgi:hypothetical protein